MSLRLPILGTAALLALALVVLATGARSRAAGPGVTPVNSAACSAIQYGGTGMAQALIVSDLPLQGDSRERSLQMNDAIRLVLEGAGWRAGGLAVAFQACDDSNAKTGLWSKARCQANARAYAADPSVLGVVGTYNSGCAEAIVPILGKAPGGGLAMVSPGNTAICLTQPSPSCTGGEPNSLYPKRRNYSRVVPNDAYQGAGLASFAKQQGIKRAYILYAGNDPTSLGQAKTFRGAAAKLGIALAGFSPWNAGASSYSGLMRRVAATSPDAVLLAGLTEQNGGRLIKDKVAAMGANGGKVKLLAPDGFAQQSTIELAGPAAKGMFASVPGRVPQNLVGPGRKLVAELQKEVKGPVELYAPYAGQAASVLLDAIAHSEGRAGVIDAVRKTKVQNGITGSFNILPSGDPSVGPITVSVARKTFAPVREVEPGPALVRAARAGGS
ncbi:MAG TPA: branched-chain amino acid ABC transporter substrate-binding protein [Solirubrobacterales bacterium]|nr:branched-chain amino acid ABC transporter substrate-binding protein [Solirubrobacterales bacterium]